MRILIPSPCFEDSFADNVRMTLLRMGHQVLSVGTMPHLPHRKWSRYAFTVGMDLLVGDRQPVAERAIVRAAKVFRPDMVLGLTAHLHRETLDSLQKLCPGRLVLWWGDAPGNSHRWGLIDPAWNLVFLKDVAAVQKLRLIGRDAFHLHEAMNPAWHRPVAKRCHNRVAVAGNYYAFRQALILRLLRDGVGFELYGPRPPRWADEVIKAKHTGRYVSREEKSKVFGAALACLNTFSLVEGNSLNCRAFEIAGAAGLQLIEHRQAIEECFEPGNELLVFSGYEELLEHLQRALKDPKNTDQIREAGAARALAEHTYTHRLQRLIDHAEGRA